MVFRYFDGILVFLLYFGILIVIEYFLLYFDILIVFWYSDSISLF